MSRVLLPTLGATTDNALSKPTATFGASNGVPLDVYVSKNQVLSRVVIELLGLDPWKLAFARNKYERLEKAWVSACWLVIGLGIPVLVQLGLRKRKTQQLAKRFHLSNNASPLKISFTKLGKAASLHDFKTAVSHATKKNTGTASFVRPLSHHALQGLKTSVRQTKMGIMVLDLLFMGLNGQLANWGKNWITKQLAGTESFSGYIGYTSSGFQEKQATQYKKEKNWRMMGSLISGVIGVASFPLLFAATLNHKGATGLGKLKKMIPHFDYTDAIYMSKWLIAWHGFFNFVVPGMFASRDKHELREHLSSMGALYFFFFVGDSIFSGMAAKRFGKKLQQTLPNIPLYKHVTLGPLRIPWGVPLHNIQQQSQTLRPHVKKEIMKLGRSNFWTGIITTALGLGISTTLINNWFTRKKIQAQQTKQAAHVSQWLDKLNSRPTNTA